jgi:hypothetical protein
MNTTWKTLQLRSSKERNKLQEETLKGSRIFNNCKAHVKSGQKKLRKR